MGNQDLALLGGPRTVTRPVDDQWPSFSEADAQRVACQVLEGGVSFDMDEGPVRALEAAARRHLGARYALAVSSGTAALHAAMFALGLGPGMSVICPTYTFFRTASPILHLGARPIFVDSEKDLENIDVSRIPERIAADTVGIIVTHWNGHPADLTSLTELARARGLWIVEDAAHAHGARYLDTPIGAGQSDAVCFSLQGKKLVPAGQGGLLCTPRQDVYEAAMLLCYFRPRLGAEVSAAEHVRFSHSGLGLNYQLNPLAALLGTAAFERLEAVVSARSLNCRILSDELRGRPDITPPTWRDYATRHPWYACRPRYAGQQNTGISAATYCAALQAEGVPIRIKRDILLHEEPLFRGEWSTLARGGAPQAGKDFGCAARLAECALDLDVPHSAQPDLMSAYADAFAKVGRNMARLANL